MNGTFYKVVVMFVSVLSLAAQAQGGPRIFTVSGHVTEFTDANFGGLYRLNGELKDSAGYEATTAFNLAAVLQTEGLKLQFDPATDINVSGCKGPGQFTINTGYATDAEILQGLQDQAVFVLAGFQCDR